MFYMNTFKNYSIQLVCSVSLAYTDFGLLCVQGKKESSKNLNLKPLELSTWSSEEIVSN